LQIARTLQVAKYNVNSGSPATQRTASFAALDLEAVIEDDDGTYRKPDPDFEVTFVRFHQAYACWQTSRGHFIAAFFSAEHL